MGVVTSLQLPPLTVPGWRTKDQRTVLTRARRRTVDPLRRWWTGGSVDGVLVGLYQSLQISRSGYQQPELFNRRVLRACLPFSSAAYAVSYTYVYTQTDG